MFSLRVAIILALSTRFDSYAVCGYTVDIPFTVENPIVETNIVFDTATPCPETINAPVIETPTVSTLEIGDQSNAVAKGQFTVLQQNFSISGHAPKGKKKSCICKECNPENGFFIKHFRQYNYYYPHGHKVTLPMRNPYPFSDEDPSDDMPVSSSISMSNTNGVKRSSKTAVKYNSPRVASYVSNNDFNYVYKQPGSGYRQSVPVTEGSPLLDQSSSSNEEPASCDESAEQTAEITSDDETAPAGDASDGNINEDIVNYYSSPNVYGHTRRTVVKNGNSHFQSQQVSISSRTQTQSQPSPGNGPQQEDGATSIVQSQSMPGSESQQQDEISSSVLSQSSSGYGAQQEDGISSIMQSQSLSGSETQQQDMSSSSMQSQSSSGYGAQQQDGISSIMQSQSFPGSEYQQQDQTSYSLQSQSFSGYGPQQQNEISSTVQSQSLSGSDPQQQDQTSSSTQSQSLSGYGPSINLANENANFGGQNIMTVGYNPYFQSQTFDLSPMLQPQPPLPMLGFQNTNWLGGSTANTQINTRKTSQYFNPIRTWQNSPAPYGPFDLTNVAPSYSVIL